MRNGARGELDVAEDTEFSASVHWPTMEMREELEHTQAQQIRHAAGIISRETWARDAGIDWEAEKERLEREAEDMFDMTPPPESGE